MGFGTTEILLICFLALILFGGGKIAELGKGLGEGILNFRRAVRTEPEVSGPGGEKKTVDPV